MGKKQNQLKKLIKLQNNKCYWCNCEMDLEIGSHNNPTGPTLEHLDDKNNPQRWAFNRVYRRVAACYKCNYNRSKITDSIHHGDLEFAIARILKMRERLVKKKQKSDIEKKIYTSMEIYAINKVLKELERVTGKKYISGKNKDLQNGVRSGRSEQS